MLALDAALAYCAINGPLILSKQFLDITRNCQLDILDDANFLGLRKCRCAAELPRGRRCKQNAGAKLNSRKRCHVYRLLTALDAYQNLDRYANERWSFQQPLVC